MTQARFNSPFALKCARASGVFEGYASVFDVTDEAGDIIRRGAFARSLREVRDGLRRLPLLWQHDPAQPIGTWLEMREDAHGLFVKGQLFLNDIPLAREAYALLKESVVTGLSIGYRVLSTQGGYRVLSTQGGYRVLSTQDDFHVRGTQNSHHAQDAPDGLARELTDIELLEISLVTFPANTFARVSRVKSGLASAQDGDDAALLRRLTQTLIRLT